MINLFSDLSVTSITFFVLVLIILGLYYIVPKKYQNLALLLSSYIFCFTWSPSFVIPLLAYSIINYWLALKINASPKLKTHLLWAGISTNLSGLLLFKYIDSIQYIALRMMHGVGIQFEYSFIEILQPIGISFYVLQAISYLIDVYRGQIPPNKDFIETFLYLSYFPKLVAGPIERAGNFFKQLRSEQEINNQHIIEGFTKIMVGLTRKIIIAETILEAIPVEIFTKPGAFSLIDLTFWWACFIFVIYNDFAGYTGIALGVSKLFGIELSQNFRQPFFSTSFIDFWNRWHISLSNWLRDYIYLPASRFMLRRNPSGKYLPNLIIPSLLTMTVSGIWHGATFHFILWGALNGLLQGIERVQKSRSKKTMDRPSPLRQSLGLIGTFLVLGLINVPFRFDIAETFEVWKTLMLWSSKPGMLSGIMIIKPILAIGLSFLIDYFQLPDNNEEKILNLDYKFRGLVTATIILLLFLASRQQALTPFIYQEF